MLMPARIPARATEPSTADAARVLHSLAVTLTGSNDNTLKNHDKKNRAGQPVEGQA